MVFAFNEFDEQMAFVATMFVAAVAFLFVMQNMVPHVGYLTYLDYYVYGSFIYLVFLAAQGTIYEVVKDNDIFDDTLLYKLSLKLGVADQVLLLGFNFVWILVSRDA